MRTVRRIQRRKKEAAEAGIPDTEAVVDKPRSGAPKKITPRVARIILDFTLGKRGRQAPQIMRHLAMRGINVGVRRIQQWLRERGAYPYHRQRQPYLSPSHKKKRAKFARDRRTQDWNKVLFSDEKDFLLFPKTGNTKNNIVWAMDPNDVPPLETKQYSEKLSVWGGVSARGKTRLVFYEGSLNAARYQAILRKALPDFDAIFDWIPVGEDDFCLAHDGATVHSARSTNTWLEEHVPNHITSGPYGEWPANSPDFNIIEHVWGHMATELDSDPPATLAGLKRRLKTLWRNLDLEMVVKMVDGMPDRLRRAIRSRGEWTGD